VSDHRCDRCGKLSIVCCCDMYTDEELGIKEPDDWIDIGAAIAFGMMGMAQSIRNSCVCPCGKLLCGQHYGWINGKRPSDSPSKGEK
jgi:hypothetical protein